MSFLTSTIIDNTQNFSLVILQSSLAQSCLPILRHLVNNPKPSSSSNLLFSLLYPPSSLADNISPDTLEIHDWLDRVPGYCKASNMPSDDLLDIVRRGIHLISFSPSMSSFYWNGMFSISRTFETNKRYHRLSRYSFIRQSVFLWDIFMSLLNIRTREKPSWCVTYPLLQ